MGTSHTPEFDQNQIKDFMLRETVYQPKDDRVRQRCQNPVPPQSGAPDVVLSHVSPFPRLQKKSTLQELVQRSREKRKAEEEGEDDSEQGNGVKRKKKKAKKEGPSVKDRLVRKLLREKQSAALQ